MTFRYAAFRAEYVARLQATHWTAHRLAYAQWESVGCVYRPTEDAALEYIARQVARLIRPPEYVDTLVVDLLREVYAERRRAREKMPLRDIMAKRGATMAWIDLGKDQRLWTEIPLTSVG